MPSFISKLIAGLCITVSTASIFVTGVTFHIINKSTKRPVYSVARKEEHIKNREILLKDFHAQPITFMTDDQLKLSGYLMVRKNARRNILVCHGYRMCKERMISFASMFPEDNILLFDHRAHGESEGDRTSIGYNEQKDVLAALKVLQANDNINKLPIYGIGTSMGAVSLLKASCQNDGFKALILDSPFAQLDGQARKTFSHKYKLSKIPFESLANRLFEYRMKFSPKEVDALLCAQEARIPIMIIHSKQDDVVPVADAQKIYDTIITKKDLWLVEKSSHARIFDDCPEEYKDHINQFFNKFKS